jgi:D-sedoheptulose 7-phosphate isomerase
MAPLADHLFAIASRDTARIQEAHMLAGHMICDWVELDWIQEPTMVAHPEGAR